MVGCPAQYSPDACKHASPAEKYCSGVLPHSDVVYQAIFAVLRTERAACRKVRPCRQRHTKTWKVVQRSKTVSENVRQTRAKGVDSRRSDALDFAHATNAQAEKSTALLKTSRKRFLSPGVILTNSKKGLPPMNMERALMRRNLTCLIFQRHLTS